MWCCMIAVLMINSVVEADEIETELNILRNELNALKDARQTYMNRLQEIEFEIRNTQFKAFGSEFLPSLVEKRASTEGPRVAFSARLSHELGNLHDDQIFVFDVVTTNQGNRYDPTTGIFHCDEAGLYVFQLSVVAVPGGYLTTQIAKNHQGQAWAFSHDPTNSSSGGTMVVLYLQPGDAVFARVNGGDHDHKHRTVAQQFTSFSGFRID